MRMVGCGALSERLCGREEGRMEGWKNVGWVKVEDTELRALEMIFG